MNSVFILLKWFIPCCSIQSSRWRLSGEPVSAPLLFSDEKIAQSIRPSRHGRYLKISAWVIATLELTCAWLSVGKSRRAFYLIFRWIVVMPKDNCTPVLQNEYNFMIEVQRSKEEIVLCHHGDWSPISQATEQFYDINGAWLVGSGVLQRWS